MRKSLKMAKFLLPGGVLAAVLIFLFFSTSILMLPNSEEGQNMGNSFQLPEPVTEGEVSFEEALNRRKSIRSFSSRPVTLKEVSQLLWAAGGQRVDAVTRHSLTYPSAGGINPLYFYLAAGNVDGLEAGLYRYRASDHSLALIKEEDVRRDLSRAALGQGFIAAAPFSIIITAQPDKLGSRYGERGEERYVYLDAGHAGQNIYLAAVSRGLGTVAVGAFNDGSLAGLLELPSSQKPLYIYPLGWPDN